MFGVEVEGSHPGGTMGQINARAGAESFQWVRVARCMLVSSGASVRVGLGEALGRLDLGLSG